MPQEQSLKQAMGAESIITISMLIQPEGRGWKQCTSRGRLWAPCRT